MLKKILSIMLVLSMLTGMMVTISAVGTATVTYSTIAPQATSVTLSTDYADGTVRYTLDGTSPTADSTAVSGAVAIPEGTYRLTSAVFDASGEKVSADFCHTYVNETLINKALQTDTTKHSFSSSVDWNGRQPYRAFDGVGSEETATAPWQYGTYMDTITYDTAFTTDTLMITAQANSRFLDTTNLVTKYDLFVQAIVGYKATGEEAAFTYVVGDATGSNRTWEKISIPAGSAVTKDGTTYFINLPAVELETAEGEPITVKTLEVRLSKADADCYTDADKPEGVNAKDYKGGIWHIKEMWFLETDEPAPAIPEVTYSTNGPIAETVTLTTNYKNATIRYTLDGTSPTADSTAVSGAVEIPEGTYRLTSAVFDANGIKISEDFCKKYVNGTLTNKAYAPKTNHTYTASVYGDTGREPYRAFDGVGAEEAATAPWQYGTYMDTITYNEAFTADTIMITAQANSRFLDTTNLVTKYDLYVQAIVGYKETGEEEAFTYVVGDATGTNRDWQKILIPAGSAVTKSGTTYFVNLPLVDIETSEGEPITVKALEVRLSKADAELYTDADKPEGVNAGDYKGGIWHIKEMYFLESKGVTPKLTFSSIDHLAESVELSTDVEGYTIRYTLDGTTPTATSTEYTGSITFARGVWKLTAAIFDGAVMVEGSEQCHIYTNGGLTNVAAIPEPTAVTESDTANADGYEEFAWSKAAVSVFGANTPLWAFDGDLQYHDHSDTMKNAGMVQTFYDEAITADALMIPVYVGYNKGFTDWTDEREGTVNTTKEIYIDLIVGYKAEKTDESWTYIVGDATGSNRDYAHIALPVGSKVTMREQVGETGAVTLVGWATLPIIDLPEFSAEALEIRLNGRNLSSNGSNVDEAEGYNGGVWCVKEFAFLESGGVEIADIAGTASEMTFKAVNSTLTPKYVTAIKADYTKNADGSLTMLRMQMQDVEIASDTNETKTISNFEAVSGSDVTKYFVWDLDSVMPYNTAAVIDN